MFSQYSEIWLYCLRKVSNKCLLVKCFPIVSAGRPRASRQTRQCEAELQVPRSGVLFFCLVSLSVTHIADVEAAPNRPARSNEPKTQELVISRDQAAAIARSASGGRVLDIRLQRSGNRSRYRVKMLLNGNRVRSIDVDATSGAILK